MDTQLFEPNVNVCKNYFLVIVVMLDTSKVIFFFISNHSQMYSKNLFILNLSSTNLSRITNNKIQRDQLNGEFLNK